MLISEAFAQTTPSGPGGRMIRHAPAHFDVRLLYFLLLRPQMRRAKEQKQMIASLQKGDEVVTSGGTLGRVTKISDNYVNVEIAPNVEITVQRPSVQTLLPKGTIKSAN
jgi:preprotein translocase subunit YajC